MVDDNRSFYSTACNFSTMVPKHAVSVSELLPQSYDNSACDRKDPKDAAADSLRVETTKINTTLWITSNDWKRTAEIFILSSFLLLVWSIFAIPTIIYALPPAVNL